MFSCPFPDQQIIYTHYILAYLSGLFVLVKMVPQRKCEIRYFANYKWLHLIYLGEQISLFIALYLLLSFLGFIFAYVVYVLQQNSKHGEREMESIFAILNGGCFIKISCSWKKRNLHKSVLLSQFNWKIKFFSIHFCHVPYEGSVAQFLNY